MYIMVSENSTQLRLLFANVKEIQETELKEYSTMTLMSCTSRFIDMMADVSTRAPILVLLTWLGMA